MQDGLTPEETTYLTSEAEEQAQILAGIEGFQRYARRGGLEKGLKIGREEGREEGKAESLVNLCEEGLLSPALALEKLATLKAHLSDEAYQGYLSRLATVQ